MKNVLASFLILTAAATSFATHVDRTQTCMTTTNDYKLEYSGGYSFGGSYTLTKLDSGAEIKLHEENDGSEEPGSSMFETVKERIYSNKKTAADCTEEGLGYDQQETKSRAALKFTQLSDEDTAKMGMRSLDTRIFNCTTVEMSPVNCFGGKDIRN